MSWHDRAACKGKHSSIFFPDAGQGSGDAAKAVCATCEVRDACLAFALSTHQQYGIWGGLNPRERGIREDVEYRMLVCEGCGKRFRWPPTRGYEPPKYCGAVCRRAPRARGMAKTNAMRRAG